MSKKEEHMRSLPSNVITWRIPVVLAAILACSLVMPLNAQTAERARASSFESV